jgi:uncharacterized protein (DUF302 family)
MNALSDGQTFVIPERFDKVLKFIRNALAEAELSIAGEFDSTEGLNGEMGKKAVRSRILLVDCPLLEFEALALDRASAVFFPLHILVSAAGDQTQVSAINPTGLFDARLPVGAAEPMEKLHARVALALESALLRSTGSNH